MSATGPLRWSARVGWWTALVVVSIVAVNAAGVWGIAVARRGVLEEADRLFRLETSARAGSIESSLAAARADLAFLAGAQAFVKLEEGLAANDPREARWSRLAAEGALLLFLRGHPEVTHLLVRSGSGTPLVAAGRRGGVPVLWRASEEGTPEPSRARALGASQDAKIDLEARGDDRAPAGGAAPLRRAENSGVAAPTAAPAGAGPGMNEGAQDAGKNRPARAIGGVFDLPGVGKPAARLEAAIDAGTILSRERAVGDHLRACTLTDGEGTVLASRSDGEEEPPGRDPSAALAGAGNDPGSAGAGKRAEAAVRTEGWSAPSPWRLVCAPREETTIALLEPLAARYRLTLGLNLLVMGLAALLGAFAIAQVRRGHILEASAQEESRVRELERQLFHAERLSTVGRLAAGIAHEINNPLEGMSNYLRLALEDIGRGDADSARRRLAGAEEGLRRAAGIVQQVLAQADPTSPSMTPLDLNTVVSEAIGFVRSRKEFSPVRFDLALADGSLPVRGNAVTLGQVFLNLLINACEAQPGGGEVSIRTARDADRILAEIADRGPGIPPADRERVFDPFYSTKRSTGLGLSICHAIVRQHEGELTVEPRTGGGALFRVSLRAAAEYSSSLIPA